MGFYGSCFPLIDSFLGGSIFDEAYHYVCHTANQIVPLDEQEDILAGLPLFVPTARRTLLKTPVAHYTPEQWAVIAKKKVEHSIYCFINVPLHAGLRLAEAVDAINKAKYALSLVTMKETAKEEVKRASRRAQANGTGKHKESQKLQRKVLEFCKQYDGKAMSASALSRAFMEAYPEEGSFLKSSNKQRTIADYIRNA